MRDFDAVAGDDDDGYGFVEGEELLLLGRLDKEWFVGRKKGGDESFDLIPVDYVQVKPRYRCVENYCTLEPPFSLLQ